MQGKLHVVFHGEEGVDAGGVTREWYQVSCAHTSLPLQHSFVSIAVYANVFHGVILFM